MTKSAKDSSKKSGKKSKESSHCASSNSRASPSKKTRPDEKSGSTKPSSTADDKVQGASLLSKLNTPNKSAASVDQSNITAYKRARSAGGVSTDSVKKSGSKKRSPKKKSKSSTGDHHHHHHHHHHRSESSRKRCSGGSKRDSSPDSSHKDKKSAEAKKSLLHRLFSKSTAAADSSADKSAKEKYSSCDEKSKSKVSKSRSRKRSGGSRSMSSVVPFAEPLGKTIYQFSVRTLKGDKVSMERYAGKTLIVVNIASNDLVLCKKNLGQLSQLYMNYKYHGLRIAAFPSNDFCNEPLDDRGLEEWVKKHEILYDVYAKVNVKGDKADPLFVWLAQTKCPPFRSMARSSGATGSTIGTESNETIKYNYTKFLIDRHGCLFRVYQPSDDPLVMESDIKSLLS